MLRGYQRRRRSVGMRALPQRPALPLRLEVAPPETGSSQSVPGLHHGSPRDNARVLLIACAPRTVHWLSLLPPRRDTDGPVLLGARRPLHVRPLQHRVQWGGRINGNCALGDHRLGPQLPTQRRPRAPARGAAAAQQGTARRTRRLQACAATASTAPRFDVTIRRVDLPAATLARAPSGSAPRATCTKHESRCRPQCRHQNP